MNDVRELYAVVDRSTAPIIHARVVGPLTDAGFDRYLAELTAAFEATEVFSVIIEQGHLQRFPARYLARSRAWLLETERAYRDRWVSTAFVLTNPVLRGAVASLFWTLRFDFELTVRSTREQATRWTESKLIEHGVDLRSA